MKSNAEDIIAVHKHANNKHIHNIPDQDSYDPIVSLFQLLPMVERVPKTRALFCPILPYLMIFLSEARAHHSTGAADL